MARAPLVGRCRTRWRVVNVGWLTWRTPQRCRFGPAASLAGFYPAFRVRSKMPSFTDQRGAPWPRIESLGLSCKVLGLQRQPIERCPLVVANAFRECVLTDCGLAGSELAM